MSTGLREPQPHELNTELERALLPRFTILLSNRGPGHCMRVSDLDLEVMVHLCQQLRSQVTGAHVYVLSDGRRASVPTDLAVTSTKLVEFRNPLPDNTLRPPLLVFIPNDLRAAAEDSFGVATFEEIALDDVYTDLGQRLLAEVPNGLRPIIAEVFRGLEAAAWPFADTVAVARYLLTVKLNDYDRDAAGAALFAFGLVPDFELFKEPAHVPIRLSRNLDKVKALTWSGKSERGRVLELGLSNRAFRALLANFVAEVGLEDPRRWTRRIVTEREHWQLSFHHWRFDEEASQPDGIFIEVQEATLPRVGDDEDSERLSRLIGQQYLPVGKKGLKQFAITFQTDPLPNKVQGLARFSVQVVSQETGPVGLVKNVAVRKSSKKRTTATLAKLGKVDWEEGWHFVRILPLTIDGDPIPLLGETGDPLPHPVDGTRQPNESDLFYVLPDGEIENIEYQRAVPRDDSLMHAWKRLQFTALLDGRDPADVIPQEVRWKEGGDRGRTSGSELIEADFGREGLVHIPVSRQLKVLEQKILQAPDAALSWRLPIRLGQVEESTGDALCWPEGPQIQHFLAVRARYFNAIRSGEKVLITQAANLRDLKSLVIEYAEAYETVVAYLLKQAESSSGTNGQKLLSDLQKVLTLDTITLDITNYRGERREAALIAPTHPLRVLWLATWAEVAEIWLHKAALSETEYVVPTRDALLKTLAPLSFPPMLSQETGQLFTAIDNLTPFWTLYAPTSEEDPRGLIGDVCAALGLPEPSMGGAMLTGSSLANRVERYLVQHPYVQTLVVNAFNPGRAYGLAGMLLELQKQPAFADIRYDIRLFVPDPAVPGIGEGFTELLSPSSGITVKEADEFSIMGTSHLYPKLSFSVQSAEKFQENPSQYDAHLTFLFDIFPAKEVSAAKAEEILGTVPVYGLVQDFVIDYTEEEHTVAWRKQPHHGTALELPDEEEFTDLLGRLPALLSTAVASVATQQVGPRNVPVITLALEARERSLIHQVHEVSDWVVTVDRHIGIEFFDHGGKPGRPDYLIDHSPDMTSSFGHRLFITSRSLQELEMMLEVVLEQYGLQTDKGSAVALLYQIRSLSGRLALKLISSPTQRAEVFGLALARLYLDYQGVFRNQIIVPLDAHIELYQTLKNSAGELGDEVSFKRTDLALFDLDEKARTITCRLVEVKCYSDAGDLGQYNQLKDQIAEQITQSEHVLAHHFDPKRTLQDRPDRLLKTHELVTLLKFYLQRSVRYQLFDPAIEGEARRLLSDLEHDYQLQFTRSALVFDFEKPGTETAENEGGIEYHRVGKDLIRQLIGAAKDILQVPEGEIDETDEKNLTESSASEGSRSLSEKELPIPRLTQAAFLGMPRAKESQSYTPEKDGLPQIPTSAKSADHVPITRPVSKESKSADSSLADRPKEAPSQEETDSSARIPVDASSSASQTDERAPEGEKTEGEAKYDILLGTTNPSPQYGIVGEVSGRKVALDLNETHTISLFGVQGGGKSYTLGTIAEMASLSIPQINVLKSSLATIIFHYSPTQDYKPEFTSMVAPNSEEAQLQILRERYGAQPQALQDVILLAPEDKLDDRRAEYPNIEIHPLKFAAAELQASHWRFLMGAIGNQSTYIRQLNRIMKAHRDELSLETIRQGIDASRLPDQLRDLAHQRLDLAAEYIDDNVRLGELIRPGRLVIVDLRDEFIEKDEALGLFVVLLQLFSEVQYEGQKFNKLVVFDEAHKYIESPDLITGLIEVVREMRHKGTSIMVASQDPPSVPVSLIELSSQIILHKFNSPIWLKHIQKANTAFVSLTAEKLAHLSAGEAYVWSSKATDETFSRGSVKIQCRPRVTQHGGETKTAVSKV